MFPILILGSVALLFAGCSGSPSKEPESPQEPLPKLVPPEDPRFEEVRQVLQATYGITNNELNTGCHLIDYSQNATQEKILSYGGDILPCEVSEYVLDRYEKYPDLARKLAGGPVPWSLDDGDPNTDFDEKIQMKVKAAFNRLDPLLRKTGLVSSSREYQEKLAVALFYFVDFPDDPQRAAEIKNVLLNRTGELAQLGLKDFQDYLFKQGGLGTSLMTEDAELEATALEALRSKKGFCTEKSKILFGVFRMAGLDPFFVHAKGGDLARYYGKTLWNGGYSGHEYLGLSWPEKTRYFDPTIFNSNAHYPNPYRERLVHALSWHLSNLGTDLATKDQWGMSMDKLFLATQFHPNNYLAWINLESVFAHNHQYPQALAAGYEALDQLPDDSNANYNLARTYWEMEYYKTAMKWVDRSIALDAEDADGYVLKGFILAGLEKYEEAADEFNKAIKLRPDWANPHLGLGKLWARQSNLEDAVEEFRIAVQLEPNNPECLYLYGLGLYALHRENEAKPILAEALRLKPKHELAPMARRALPD